MVRYTCDLCGKELAEERRYVVRMEVYPGSEEPADDEEDDLSPNHLEEMAQLIDEADAVEPPEGEATGHGFRFDLCPECYQRFIENPLARETTHRLRYSDN